jgi:hypothetical protein
LDSSFLEMRSAQLISMNTLNDWWDIDIEEAANAMLMDISNIISNESENTSTHVDEFTIQDFFAIAWYHLYMQRGWKVLFYPYNIVILIFMCFLINPIVPWDDLYST